MFALLVSRPSKLVEAAAVAMPAPVAVKFTTTVAVAPTAIDAAQLTWPETSWQVMPAVAPMLLMATLLELIVSRTWPPSPDSCRNVAV